MKNAVIHVLAIEDNPDDAELIRRMLQKSRATAFTFIRTPQLSEGLRALREGSLDIVLLDLGLPDSVGMESVLKIRQQAPTIPIIVFTGNDDDEMALKALHLDVQDYLPKGQIDGNLLVRSIRYAIERKRAVEEIVHMAYHDVLTGLPNRRLFMELLRFEMDEARRNRTKTGLLFLDLDRFKEVNDTLGHEAGDQLLRMVAERLRASLRDSDAVARLGGDEFSVHLAGVKQPEDIAIIARKILDAFRRECVICGRGITITASMGISICPDDSDNIESLFRCADSALYRAKNRGGNTFEFYNPDISCRGPKQFEHA